MKRKIGSAERLGALPDERALQVAADLARLSSKTARAIASRLSELAGVEAHPSKTAELLMTDFLEEELLLFALKASRVLAETEGIRSLVLAESVRQSAAKRSRDSRKAHLLTWARRERETNPGESKASLARRYLSSHPGINISQESAKRYLAGELD